MATVKTLGFILNEMTGKRIDVLGLRVLMGSLQLPGGVR